MRDNEGATCPHCGRYYHVIHGHHCAAVNLNIPPIKEEPMTQDNINNPRHYTSHKSGIECIDITEHMNFCLGNAIKYIWRVGLKDGTTKVNDLKKAIWYLTKELEKEERI